MSVHISNDEKPSWRVRYLRQFGRDEDGSIIVLTLLVLIAMLVVGGMAVDFMRFESRRVLLQNVSDRAVLAAAELDQTLDTEEVVRGYFRSEGLEDTITPGKLTFNDTPGSRSVGVESELDLRTFYLRLVGIENLSAKAVSGAIEGTGNIEISLVLDISGSMGRSAGNGQTRMALLQDAATDFVNDLLIPEYRDKISLSLVTYSANVNIGDDIYRALNTTPDTILKDGTLIDLSDIPALEEQAADDTNDFTPEDLENMLEGKATNPWRCVEIRPEEFTTTVFNTEREYVQAARLDDRTNNTDEFRGPLCPEDENDGIIAYTQNAALLTSVIDNLRPTRTTSIHLGMKWGVSLLDPSMRELLSNVGSVDPAFRGVRPLDYEENASVEDAKKYLILMTDGENVSSRRVRDDIWDQPFWRRTFTNYPYLYWYYEVNDHPEGLRPGWGGVTEEPDTAAQQDIWLQQICDAARDNNIIVYTISMGAPPAGVTQMERCAFEPAYFFDAEETPIGVIFENIGQQITDLRLSQ